MKWQEYHKGDYLPIPYEYPSSQSILIIQNQAVITINYRHHLIYTYTELQYIEFMQRKNGWSDTKV